MDPTAPVANVCCTCDVVSLHSKRLCGSCFREASQSSQAVNEDVKRYIKEEVQYSVKVLLPASSRRDRSTHQIVQEDDSSEPGLVTRGLDVDSQVTQDEMDSFSFDFPPGLGVVSV